MTKRVFEYEVGQKIPIAIAGCGVVGSALIRLLQKRAREIEDRTGLGFELVSLLVRDPSRERGVEIEPEILTTDLEAFLDSGAEIVVEVIGGLGTAAEIARQTLARGADLVTANKALLAESGAELTDLARISGARLEFEAAVGGGAPIIETIRTGLAETGIRKIRGILNGTTNYILTRLSEGADYETALADAQRAGFAEADPTRDIDGTDAADKIRILGWLAFGTDPSEITVEREGILPDPDTLAAKARERGGVVRSIAEVEHRDDLIHASVAPLIVADDSEWAMTRYEENLVTVETSWNGTIRIGGPGAGGYPTASAVLADLIRVAESRALTRTQIAPLSG